MRDSYNEGESTWFTGVDLEWRTPPPTHRNGHTNGGHKRTWEDAATPVQDEADPLWNNGGLELLPELVTNVTTELFGSNEITSHDSSQNGGISLDAVDDDVEEIPRTKMQTGCIPCL